MIGEHTDPDSWTVIADTGLLVLVNLTKDEARQIVGEAEQAGRKQYAVTRGTAEQAMNFWRWSQTQEAPDTFRRHWIAGLVSTEADYLSERS